MPHQGESPMSDNQKMQTKLIRNVKFWKSERGFYLSHSKGLTQDQIEFLQGLMPGDKLIIFGEKNEEGREILTMKKSTMLPKEETPLGVTSTPAAV
jgi:hypothetical protein